MIPRRNGRVYECVVVDVNTQRDFFEPDGGLPVVNARELLPAMRHMVAWAKRNQAPVISSIESHRPCDLDRNGSPAYCIDGSIGQRKIEFTTFPQNAYVEVDNTLSCPVDLFRQYQQVVFRKRSNDLLANPKADRFFTQVPAAEFILFGVGIEESIKALALGLLARDKRVSVVVDACGYWNRAMADLALRQITAKGAAIVSVSEVLSRRLERNWRYPSLRKNGHARRNGSNHKPRFSRRTTR